ncbi:MAG: hypothetical protein ACM3U0_01280 [archaeon]
MPEFYKETENKLNEQKETPQQEGSAQEEEKAIQDDLSADNYTLENIEGKPFLKSGKRGKAHYICLTTKKIFYDRNMIIESLKKENPDEEKEVSLTESLLSGREADPNILDRIKKHIKKYIYFADERIYSLMTVFAALTHSYEPFDRIPYLWLNGQKGSGKTTLMSVVSDLVNNPIICANISTAALFRLVDEERPTLFIDEAEILDKRNATNHDILQVLNSGYERSGNVVRVIQYEPVTYSTYCPKVIAGINKLHPTIMDRCVKIEMKKSPNGVIPYIKTEEHLSEIKALKNELILSLPKIASGIELFRNSTEYEEIRLTIKNRDFDRWFPLLAIAYSLKTESVDLYSDILSLASKELEQKKMEKSRTPEAMCKKIVSEYAEFHLPLNGNKSNTRYFRADDIRDEIMEKDEYNDYTNKAEVTKVLKEIGARMTRLRVDEPGSPAVQIYIFDEEFFQKNENEEG